MSVSILARCGLIPAARGPAAPGRLAGIVRGLAATSLIVGCDAAKPPVVERPSEPQAVESLAPEPQAPPSDQPAEPLAPSAAPTPTPPLPPSLSEAEIEAAVEERLAAAEALAEESRFEEAFMAAREAERLARGGDRGAECSALVARLREHKREAAELWFSVEKLADEDSLAVGVAGRKLRAAGPVGVVLLRQIVREGDPTAAVRALGLLADGPAARFINDVSRRFAAESDPQLRQSLLHILVANPAEISSRELAALARRAEAALESDPAADDGRLLNVLMAVYLGPAGGDAVAFDARVDRPGLADQLSRFIPPVAAVVPKAFKSAAGATAAIADDGVVLVTGNLAKDTYTLEAETPTVGWYPQAIRIDVLPDPSLPAEGPGRSPGGNFVLSTFAVRFGPPGGSEAATAVAFASAKATFEQDKYGAASAIDDKADTGWAISGGTGKPQSATFEIPADVKIPPGAPLVITLDQQHPDGAHAIGKFKVSLIQSPPQAQPEDPPPEAPQPEQVES